MHSDISVSSRLALSLTVKQGLDTQTSLFLLDFINLSITKFQLTDTEGTEDNSVTLLSGKSFALDIKAPAGANGSVDKVTFWLEQGDRSVQINSPFGTEQTDKFAALQIGSEEVIDLGSTGLDDRLVVSAEEGGYFCQRQHEDLFLVVKVTGTPVESDYTDNEARINITLTCIGGRCCSIVL